jgi:hypothetical protein
MKVEKVGFWVVGTKCREKINWIVGVPTIFEAAAS